MKKSYYYLILILVSVLGFGACSDDDNDIPDNIPDNIPVIEYDEVAYLQNSLVRVDADHQFLYRVCGEPLDKADTTKLYVGVADMDAAQQLFKGLFPPGTKFDEQADGTINVTLKGNAGTASLNVAQGEEGELAVATFHTTPALQFVSSLHFISNDVWEENGKPTFAEGQVITFNEKKYVCIRAKGNGLPSLFLHITDKESPNDPIISNVTEAEANIIHDLLYANDNFSTFQLFFQDAGIDLEEDESYWISGHDPGTYRWEDFYFTYYLKEGKVIKRNWFKCDKYRKWLVRTFNF